MLLATARCHQCLLPLPVDINAHCSHCLLPLLQPPNLPLVIFLHVAAQVKANAAIEFQWRGNDRERSFTEKVLHMTGGGVDGVGYGMEMDVYKSQILASVLVQKQNVRDGVLNCMCWCLYVLELNVHIPAYPSSRGKHFSKLQSFLGVSANRRLVQRG
jgi:hypothetical protein